MACSGLRNVYFFFRNFSVGLVVKVVYIGAWKNSFQFYRTFSKHPVDLIFLTLFPPVSLKKHKELERHFRKRFCKKSLDFNKTDAHARRAYSPDATFIVLINPKTLHANLASKVIEIREILNFGISMGAVALKILDNGFMKTE